jgi:DNA-directed RNA polymerase subunit RPC12/RpoP
MNHMIKCLRCQHYFKIEDIKSKIKENPANCDLIYAMSEDIEVIYAICPQCNFESIIKERTIFVRKQCCEVV